MPILDGSLAVRSDSPAYLNHGRWVVHCPSPVCVSALKVTPGVDLQMICQCQDDSVCDHHTSSIPGLSLPIPICGVAFRIAWPSDDVLADVHRLTRLRPRANRNWHPGEAMDQLVAENDAHGIDPEFD